MAIDINSRSEEIQTFNEEFALNRMLRTEKFFGWSVPIWPAFKLNSDGGSKLSKESSAGGLIRDANGGLVAGSGMNIGDCSSTIAELWGLYRVSLWHGIRAFGFFKLKLIACVSFNFFNNLREIIMQLCL